MRERKTSYPTVNIGSSFMLVILIILCMVVFAVLCLSGAMRDSRYSDTRAQRTKLYYAANSQAEEKLAEVDQALADAAGSGQLYTASYQRAALEQLRGVEGITAAAGDGTSLVIQYSVPINEEQALSVSLLANDSQAQDDAYYHITQWKQISTADWNGDSKLPVLGSE